MMHPYSCIQTLSSLQIPRHLDAFHHPMMVWPPPKTMIPPLFLLLSCYSFFISWLDSLKHFSPFGIYFSSLRKYHALIHISPPLESNHLKSLAPKKVLQNNIAQEKVSSIGSYFHDLWSNCMISMKITIENFTTVDHKITKLVWHELNFPQVCTQHGNVKIKCTTKSFNKKA